MIVAMSLAIPIIAMTSLLDGRLPGTHDAWLHLMRMTNAALNLKEGVLIPRWGPHLHFGFGYPLGNFYTPGWHVAGGALVAAGVPAVSVLLVFQAIGLLLYPLGGYLFARLFTDRVSALLGAAICLLAPLRFYEVFIQGNVSQLIGMGLIVWVLWAFARCALAPRRGTIVVASLLLAALILTHHPTSAFAVPLAGGYSVFAALIPSGQRRRRLAAVLIAYGLGLLLAATYWLPAVTELHYVHVQAAADQYQLQDNFVRLRDLIGLVQAPDRGALNVVFTFSAGLGSLVLGALGGVVALSPRVKLTRWQRGHVLAGLLLAAICLYAMTYRSLWLWEAVPQSKLILFPWRLLSVLTAALIPGAALLMMVIPTRWRAWVVAGLIGVLLAAVLPLMFPLYANESDLGTVTPASSIEYEVRSGNLGGVSNNEYLPKWAEQRPDFAPCPDCYRDWAWQVFVNDRTLPDNAQVTAIEGEHRTGSGFEVSSPAAFRLELHQMYFPGWKATVDGKTARLIISEPYGLMAVDLPAGAHTVEVWYAGTRVQQMGNSLSLIALGGCVGLLVFPMRRRRMIGRVSRPDVKVASAAVIGSVIVAVVLRGIVVPHTNWFREAGGTPPGMEQARGTVFADADGTPQLKLIGYTLSDTRMSQDDWLFVTLYWQALTPLDQQWHVRLALADTFTQAEWSASDHDAPGGFSTLQWPTDRYVIDRHILRLDDDTPPYGGDLGGRVSAGEGEQLLADAAPRLSLEQVRIDEKGTDDLPAGAQRVDLVFGDWLRCRAYDLVQAGDGYQLRLYWQVLRDPPADFALMLHWMRQGEDVGNADQPPLASYPTHLWREGQYLVSMFDLVPPEKADALWWGLYDYPTVQRAAVDRRDGKLVVQDNAILVPLE